MKSLCQYPVMEKENTDSDNGEVETMSLSSFIPKAQYTPFETP